MNRRKKDTLGDGSRWEYAYDQLGQLTNAVKFDAGSVTNLNRSFSYTADGIGNVLTAQSPAVGGGETFSYSYNGAGDLTGVDYADSTPDVGYGYDRQGRQTTVTNGGSLLLTRAFNDVGQVLGENYSSGALSGLLVSNRLDGLLRRTNTAVFNGSTRLASSDYSFDVASRLDTVGDGTNTATYAYVANSPLIDNVSYKQNGTVRLTRTNQFDQLNRLTNVVWTAGTTVVASFARQYNDANQCTRETLAAGSYWLYQYDTLGQVTSAKKYWSDGTPIAGQQTTFTFDDIGNRISAASGGDASGANLRPASYSANLLNQYSSRTVPGYVNVLGEATNAATVTVNLQPTYRFADYFRAELLVTNASALWLGITNIAVLNQGTNADLIATNVGNLFVPAANETFLHDADGNLTNDGRFSYTWDAENRALSFTRISSAPSGSKVKLDCTYDPQWRRTQKIVSIWNGSTYVAQSTNKFIYDGWNLLAILNHTNGLMQSFVWGTDASGTLQGAGGVGGLISTTIHQGTNAGTYFYCYNGSYNVAALVNASNGAVAGQWEYDAFLNVIRATGPLAYANPFLGSTKFYDWETGLYYYGYRYYDPSAGRWLGRDPIGEAGNINVYGFVINNPAGILDALGLKGATLLIQNPSLDFPSRLIPDPNNPDVATLDRSGTYKIPKCSYMILIGHGRHQPETMKPGNECSYGAAYGCYTGGGDYENPNPDKSKRVLPGVIHNPPVHSPGIPGGPNQPDDGVIADEVLELATTAFDAAVKHAKEQIRSNSCGCKKFTVQILCVGPTTEASGFSKEVKALCGKKMTVTAP